ncbi:MAG: hypothetical protein AAGH64_02690 [Planctomycetota bacterium]
MHRRFVFVLALLLTPLAFGQMSGSYGLFSREDFRPAIGEAQMAIIARALGLDERDRAFALELHGLHVDRVLEEGGEVRRRAVEIVEEAQLSGRGEMVQQVTAVRAEWSERRDALDKEFLEELRVVLQGDEDGRWRIVERELRRMEQIGAGRMAGEAIDLTLLAEAEGVEMTDDVVSVLERYAGAMDTALRARSAYYENNPPSEYSALVGTDPDRAKRMFERMRRAREGVRDVNRAFIDPLASAAGAEIGARLREAFIGSVTSSANLSDSIAQRAIDGAGSLRNLDDDQARAIEEIRDDFNRQNAAWLEEYAEVLMEVEGETLPDDLLIALGEMTPREDDDYFMRNSRERIPALRKIWRERLELDRSVRERVYAVLTTSQADRMPLLVSRLTIRSGNIFGAGERRWY